MVKNNVETCYDCSPGESVHHKRLYVSPGIFRDFDSDFADGIPVCTSCGGLGRVILKDEEFMKSVEEIKRLRTSSNPGDIEQEARKQLIDAVKRHYETYRAIAMDNCFAGRIS